MFALVMVTLAAAPNDPWIGPDKALHFSVSAGLSAGGYAAASFFTDDIPTRLAVGATLAGIAGIGKEILDVLTYGYSSYKDLAWDALGITTGLVLSWLVNQLIVRVMLN
ncbi:MAG: YfiM family protein [Archangium sp.]